MKIQNIRPTIALLGNLSVNIILKIGQYFTKAMTKNQSGCLFIETRYIGGMAAGRENVNTALKQAQAIALAGMYRRL